MQCDGRSHGDSHSCWSRPTWLKKCVEHLGDVLRQAANIHPSGMTAHLQGLWGHL